MRLEEGQEVNWSCQLSERRRRANEKGFRCKVPKERYAKRKAIG